MSVKYHINPETKRPNICRVKIENCSVSTEEADHYLDKENAVKASENNVSKTDSISDLLVAGEKFLGNKSIVDSTTGEKLHSIRNTFQDKINETVNVDTIQESLEDKKQKIAEDFHEKLEELEVDFDKNKNVDFRKFSNEEIQKFIVKCSVFSFAFGGLIGYLIGRKVK